VTAVPVLMYHEVAERPHPRFSRYTVSLRSFARQMRWLAARGYHTLDMDALLRARTGRAPLPERPIVLTFDDGYRGDFGAAMPILRRRGWPGVLNLLVANLHRRGWGLKAWQVQRMIANGWEVDSHTLTHPDLATVSAGQLWQEVHRSRVVLRRLFHVPVRFFCYPSGAFDAAVIAAVRRAGYLGATTEIAGPARRSQPYTLARIRVDAGEPPAELVKTIRNG